jgi:lysophospholipase L1-like esterase
VPRPGPLMFRARQGSLPALMVILLAVAGIAGDSALVATLRGYSAENESNEVHTLGYYEGLINAPRPEIAGDGPEPPPGWLPFGGDETGIVRELPAYLRWEMKPNLDIRWNGKIFQTNSLGFRTPEVSLRKPEGTYRILLFGSSNTMGYGVDNGDEYARHLERWLNEWRWPAHRVEVINLAVAGDSPTRKLERLRKEAKRWSADWILCDATALDSWLEDNHIHSVLQRKLPIPFAFVTDAVRRSGVTGADSLEGFRDKFRGESEKLLAAVYAGWNEEARRLHVPLTLLILPRADSKGRSPRVFQLIRTLAGRNGLDFLDLSAAFDHMSVDEFRISDWDKHPNGRGHQVIFEALRDAIMMRAQLPAPTSFAAASGATHAGSRHIAAQNHGVGTSAE